MVWAVVGKGDGCAGGVCDTDDGDHVVAIGCIADNLPCEFCVVDE